MAGNDLRSMTPEIRDILTNTEIIAVDQDATAGQGSKIRQERADLEVWVKKLAGNGKRARSCSIAVAS